MTSRREPDPTAEGGRAEQADAEHRAEHRTDDPATDRSSEDVSGEPRAAAIDSSREAADSLALYGCEELAAAQRSAVTDGRVPVAVYGLGKMGLPLAAVFASVTGNTTGVDIDEGRVAAINDGQCPVEREPGLSALIDRTVEDGSLRAVTDGARAAAAARLHVVIVPTLVEDDGTPDLSLLRAAVETVAAGLEPGDVVCLESTVPPGTTRSVVEPLLAAESGCDPDSFGLAFCPERTASGRALRDIGGSYPKVVGGVDDESTRVARLVYELITTNEVLAVSDATTAEAVKVFEGVYRDVNIALANELATFADELGIDVREAIATANSQPYCDLHTPGPGVGGHCIPYYPHFLIEGLSTPTPLLEQARHINDSMPAFTVGKVVDGLRTAGVPLREATVGVLGLAYRPGVAETRESPGVAIGDLLREIGMEVRAADPVVGVREHGFEPLESLDDDTLDAVVYVTAHEEFASIRWDEIDSLVVVDGRAALDLDGSQHQVSTIGVGERADATSPRGTGTKSAWSETIDSPNRQGESQRDGSMENGTREQRESTE
jgi:UDP-N-acetyl-D-mannosaminuronic acid dehydrogenase